MSIEAMKLALEALEQLQGGCTDSDDGTVEAITVWCPEVIDALRQAIEQAEKQEPYGYFRYDMRLDAWVQNREYTKGVAFYTFPPPRQPLTDEEVKAIFNSVPTAKCQSYEHWRSLVARAIEVAHGITGESE